MVISAFASSTSAPSPNYQLWRSVIVRELNLRFLKGDLLKFYDEPEVFVDYLCLLEHELMFYRSHSTMEEIAPRYQAAYTDVVHHVIRALGRFDYMSNCSDEDIRYIDRWGMMFDSIDTI